MNLYFPGPSAHFLATVRGLVVGEAEYPLTTLLARVLGANELCIAAFVLLLAAVGAAAVVVARRHRRANCSLAAVLAVSVCATAPTIFDAVIHPVPEIVVASLVALSSCLALPGRGALPRRLVAAAIVFLLAVKGDLFAWLGGFVSAPGWLLALGFSVFPAVVIAAMRRFSFALAASMSALLALAVATPLSPSELLAASPFHPVLASAALALALATAVLDWWESGWRYPNFGRAVALVMMVLAAAAIVSAARGFDPSRGDFADALARRLLDRAGTNAVVVTDGQLDDHLLLAAADRSLPIVLFDERALKTIPAEAVVVGDPEDWRDREFGMPYGWGSVTGELPDTLTERLRLGLRRRFGKVATDLATRLEDEGNDVSAWKLYNFVLDSVDADNVSAMFNLLAMAERGCKPAQAARARVSARLDQVAADPRQHYRPETAAAVYGRIRRADPLAGPRVLDPGPQVKGASDVR